jgi:hypothetical protein
MSRSGAHEIDIMERLRRAQPTKLTKVGADKPLTKYVLKFPGAIKEPEYVLPVKIFMASFHFKCGPTYLYHDAFYFITNENKCVSDFVVKRYTHQVDETRMSQWILPRFQENCYDSFVKDYPDGVIIHVMGIYSLPSPVYDLLYNAKEFPDGQVL